MVLIIIFFLLVGGFLVWKKSTKQPYQELPTDVNHMIKITSSAFNNGEAIPKKYSCDGEDINPALVFANIPQNAKSLVLIVDDPDAPVGTFTHWLVWNINPQTTEIKENSVPVGALQGKNTAGSNNWISPCPPSGQHRYFFRIFALDTTLNLSTDSDRKALENAMANHIIDTGELMGVYKRG